MSTGIRKEFYNSLLKYTALMESGLLDSINEDNWWNLWIKKRGNNENSIVNNW